jgi:hypothetical protein
MVIESQIEYELDKTMPELYVPSWMELVMRDEITPVRGTTKVVGVPSDKKEFYRRPEERTFYSSMELIRRFYPFLDMDGRYLALKEFRNLENATKEYDMLERGRGIGLQCGIPLAVNCLSDLSLPYRATKKLVGFLKEKSIRHGGVQLIKQEKPFLLTELKRISDKFQTNELQNYLSNCFRITLAQLYKLMAHDMIHYSITPITHDGRDKWNYELGGQIATWNWRVNIDAFGNLRDFEHVEQKSLEHNERQPLSEIVLTYTLVGFELGFNDKDIKEIMKAAVGMISDDDFKTRVRTRCVQDENKVSKFFEECKDFLGGADLNAYDLRDFGDLLSSNPQSIFYIGKRFVEEIEEIGRQTVEHINERGRQSLEQIHSYSR